jgi:hypothetical protein
MSRLNEGSKRILTTHTGSLPRPDALSALLFARMTSQPYDAAALAQQTTEAVAGIIAKQILAYLASEEKLAGELRALDAPAARPTRREPKAATVGEA